MRFRRFLSFGVVMVLLIQGFAVSACAANWGDEVNRIVLVPLADLLCHAVVDVDKVYDTVAGTLGEDLDDILNYWGKFFGPNATENYDDYVTTNNYTTVDYHPGEFTKTLYLGGTGTLTTGSYAFPADDSYVLTFGSSQEAASFSMSTNPYYDSSSKMMKFSLHCYKAGYVFFGGVSSSFSPSIDCYVSISLNSSSIAPSYFVCNKVSSNSYKYCFLVVDDTLGSVVYSFFDRTYSSSKLNLTAGHSYHLEYCFGFCLGVNSGNSVSNIWIYVPYVSDFPVRPGTDPAGNEVPAASRMSSITQVINNYNTNYSYIDNSTNVNYYLVPKGQEPSGDTAASPVIYDEDTLVFTEPATGAQYQTTGWTYDYATRTYDIDLDAGTYTLDGSDVTRIVSTYGDELVTITYYDASGTALATDEYNYVMVSGSACAIDGHSYNVETTKEASCTAAGERTYTCSVCGDQYVEEISKLEHIYAEHSWIQEPSCTVGGIRAQTCATCGGQITEVLDPLGHDWIAKEVSETTYEVPAGTSCPSCSGTNYTFVRNGVIYTCTCPDCGAEWTVEADVTYGSTTYVCSRCGESKVEADATEETQETWFTKLLFKFNWLTSVADIYKQLIADVTSDAATAAAVADGSVTLADVTGDHAATDGETVTYTAPELAVSFGESDKYGVDWAAIKPLDLSWYAQYKETVDGILSGILWLSYLYLLIKRAPGIIRGAEMVTEDRIKIDTWNWYSRL